MASSKYFSSFVGTRGFTLFMILQLLTCTVVGERTGCSMGGLEQEKHNVVHIENMSIKTIQSEDGDIIDCVDILRQPALNHPLLKNHTIKMRPSFNYGELKSNLSSKLRPVRQIWRRSGSCPVGTIPIRRNTEENLSKGFPFPKYGEEVASIGRFELAGARCTTRAPYYGIRGGLNVWAIYVENCEFSLNYVLVASRSRMNYVRAGWGVHPLFGDFRSRVFVNWKSYSRGCYNLDCPGFVQVNNNVVLGGVSEPLSTYNGPQYGMDIEIIKDDAHSTWNLFMLGHYVGYWPVSLFSDLETGAGLEWAGIVYNNNENGRHTSTQMGSGHPASEGFKKAAFIYDVQAMTSDRVFVSPDEISYGATIPSCYNVQYPANFPGPGASFFYGGGAWSGCG